ncbi:tRNA-dihydrouridine(20/20a) synthase [Thalassocella blandensis]|nr:tRNA-dihydrouridine(20/20a) synthase [Thalassocella blandensis]
MSSTPAYHRFSIAPMMDWSDRHCRYFWRLLTQHSLLYTEMVTTGALIHGDRERFLRFNAEEQPLAIQLGGSSPEDLAQCATMAEDWGYTEVNLNCGCPSDRVQVGKIGAILMAEPELVAQCVSAMREACSIPVTVKHRIGIDDMDDYEGLRHFVATVASAGCDTFIVHARKAWLKGLSPKENREVPPLRYELVYQLKQEFPHLNIIINGGITTIEQTSTLLEHVDGVMIGREAYHNPYFLAEIDQVLFNDHTNPLSREQILLRFVDYCESEIKRGTRLHHMSRHILGLYQGQPRARIFRRYITENASKAEAGSEILREALEIVQPS